ncbi:MAG: late competence development ComFB family protein [Caryophanon sp.]|nr:late competence development ComFB family protein [Caryophanon sp.]
MTQSDVILINVTEEIVRGLVSFMLRGPEYQAFCNCTICEMDVNALTLNALPPKYVSNPKMRDAAFKELNTPENIEIINREIIRAIHTVARKPKHK